MQKVNVLPAFVSQDTDIKRNESPSSQGVSRRDKDFSRLVDQHLRSKEAAERNDKRAEDERYARNREAAKADNYRDDKVADSGKAYLKDEQVSDKVVTELRKSDSKIEPQQNNKTVDTSSRSDSDKDIHSGDDSVNEKVSMQEGESTNEATDEAKDEDSLTIQQKETIAQTSTEKEAMLASEKFISLLYKSDHALTNNNNSQVMEPLESSKTPKSELTIDDESQVLKSDKGALKGEGLIVKADKYIVHEDAKNTAELTHKLAMFSAEATKGGDVDLVVNKELLNRYQQQLKDNQGLSKAAIIEQNLSASKDNGFKHTPLPIEPIIEIMGDELASSEQDVKKGTVKADENSPVPLIKTKLVHDTLNLEDSVNTEAEALVDDELLKDNTSKIAPKPINSVLNQVASELANNGLTQEKVDGVLNSRGLNNADTTVKESITQSALIQDINTLSEINTKEKIEVGPVIETKSIIQNNSHLVADKVDELELSLEVKQNSTKNSKNDALPVDALPVKEQTSGAEIKVDKALKDIVLNNAELTRSTQDDTVKAGRTVLEQEKLPAQTVFQQNTAKPLNSTGNPIYASQLKGTEESVKSVEVSQVGDEYAAKVDELSLTDTELSLLNKEGDMPKKVLNNHNQTESATRAFTDFAGQSSQIKQASDAYSVFQNTEVLNHTVATDTAQIQKNNVQLHQEMISIFRKDFSDAVKDKVMLMISQKLQQFDISLDPPEFGNMQVRVNLQGEQAAVNFVVQNQQAKDALEQNMHKLREMLAEQGVDVGGANVEQQNQNNGSNKEQSEQASARSALLTNDLESDPNLQVLSANLFNSSATGVDYYA